MVSTLNRMVSEPVPDGFLCSVRFRRMVFLPRANPRPHCSVPDHLAKRPGKPDGLYKSDKRRHSFDRRRLWSFLSGRDAEAFEGAHARQTI